MQRCLDLAALGRGMVAPNPMVGCVITDRNGVILGEGFHQQYGGAHAEVNALQQTGCTSLPAGCTMYVNLEPCSHYGKTPPCTDAILRHGISRVVVGTPDPNPLVAGKGLGILGQAGCEVISGILEENCLWLNRRFFTFQHAHRPYIILKWARTRDGFLDIIRTCESEPRPTWITGEEERVIVHKWRSEESAIMAGTRTLRADNPALNLRHFTGKQPLRIVPDRKLTLDGSLKVLDGTSPTLVLTEQQPPAGRAGLRYRRVASLDDLSEVLNVLWEEQVLSVFVEGGAQLLKSFLDAGLWDEARVFTGYQQFCEGVAAPADPPAPLLSEHNFPHSQLRIYINPATQNLTELYPQGTGS